MPFGKFACALVATCAAVSASATTITFDTDPFAGSTALTTPGRQVVGGELFLPSFSIAGDVFAFDPVVFGVSSLSFFNGADDAIPAGANVVVLQTIDNDGNAGTPFNAGTAADLIAAELTTPGPGFFIYMNSGLDLRRLVFSTDLSDPTADLKILARILDPTGAAAIATLPTFTADNFALVAPTAVPAPLSLPLLGTAVGIGLAARRRRRD
ncbi:MAG: hypothetical protein JNK67_28630 [Alphaproteobacteria bacterium]|nr:hypothetical protein [Alphaproteobacteria bacterium]